MFKNPNGWFSKTDHDLKGQLHMDKSHGGGGGGYFTLNLFLKKTGALVKCYLSIKRSFQVTKKIVQWRLIYPCPSPILLFDVLVTLWRCG